MYKETSIQLGIFRKKEKDSVIIEGEEYVIEQLLPLDVFFFRICMNKLLEKIPLKQGLERSIRLHQPLFFAFRRSNRRNTFRVSLQSKEVGKTAPDGI